MNMSLLQKCVSAQMFLVVAHHAEARSEPCGNLSRSPMDSEERRRGRSLSEDKA